VAIERTTTVFFILCNAARLSLLEGSETQTHSIRMRKQSSRVIRGCSQARNKTEGNYLMKITTNPILRSLKRLPFLALPLATVALLTLVPQLACAGNAIPFQANFITQFTTVLEFPILHVTVESQGEANCMGRITAYTTNQIENVIDGSGSATYTLAAKNGDSLIVSLVVPIGGTINVDGGVLFSGTYTVIGGTGQFVGAIGSGVFGGSAFFTNETDGIGAFAIVGDVKARGL
jgi:hypothetical protein